MFKSFHLPIAIVLISLPQLLIGQTQPANDPQAVALAAQSIAAITGGTSISDVTLTGTVNWNDGSDTGTATLTAVGTGESRMDLALGGGSRTEIRDAQTGVSLGQWMAPNSATGAFAAQNCWTDAAWFFPVLGSLAAGPNVVLSYVGQESRGGATVQHIQTYIYQAQQLPGMSVKQLSTTDFYLDAVTSLPVAVVFNAHPDEDASTNLLIEIDFSNYQTINGILAPLRITRILQGNPLMDFTVSTYSFNTGLSLTTFSIN